MRPFPFKTLTCYQVNKTFESPRSNDVFTAGQKITYLSSTLNHYEGIEICVFKDLDTGKELTWHADEIALENSDMYLRVVPYHP
jgi:hypothetical protein